MASVRGSSEGRQKVTCARREWNQAYAQLEMERGFCSLGGAEKYSPELVQRRALESPAAAARVALRGGEMLWRLGLFACSLLADNLAGLSEEGDRVRLRARQLRCGPRLLYLSREQGVLGCVLQSADAVAPARPHAASWPPLPYTFKEVTNRYVYASVSW